MSNSYVIGIAVGIAFGIMFVAFIFSYLKKKGKDICEYDERQKLAQLKGWKAAFIAAVCFDIINAMAVDIFGPWASMITMSCCSGVSCRNRSISACSALESPLFERIMGLFVCSTSRS